MSRSKRTPERAKREPLTRERIETAALELIEREGLEGFSLRGLGGALGVEAMSLYHHFPSKAHLLDALIERVLGEIELAPLDADWKASLWRTAESFRATARRYPKFFQFFAVHRLNNAAGLRYINHILAGIRAGGFDDETTAKIFRSIGYYLTGAGLEESAGYAKGPSSITPVPDDVVAREYPHVVAVGRYFKPEHFNSIFEFGLTLFTEGIERRAPAALRAERPRRDGARPAKASAKRRSQVNR